MEFFRFGFHMVSLHQGQRISDVGCIVEITVSVQSLRCSHQDVIRIVFNVRKISALHERGSSIANSDYKPSFNEVLQQDNSSTINHRNIQGLLIEI